MHSLPSVSSRSPQRRVLLVTAISAALAASVLIATAVLAVGGKTWAPSTFSSSRSTATHRTTADSYRVDAYMKWNASARTALRNRMAATGWKYTQEQNDDPVDHLTAMYNGIKRPWSTNMPNPVHDLDDDDGDYRWEEAEVTADTTNWPIADYGYMYRQEWSRWRCTVPCYTPHFDGGMGQIVHLSQMSSWLGEFNNQDSTTIYWETDYPTKAAPAGAVTAAPVDSGATADVPGSVTPVMIETDALTIALDAGGREVDALVSRDAAVSLAAYIRSEARMARDAFLSGGAQEVVVTFERPLTTVEFGALSAAPGVELADYEAIGTLDGVTWTYGGGSPAGAAARARADGVKFLGFTSFGATLADSASYERLRALDDILLIDFAPAAARAAISADSAAKSSLGADTLDVVINDVYWEHAGLTR